MEIEEKNNNQTGFNKAVIPKEKVVKFLVEKCYKNFPELMEMIPETEMYNRLNKNISVIIGFERKNSMFSGCYFNTSKNINLYSLEDLKTLENYKSVITHEGIHALFRKNRLSTGIRETSHLMHKRKIKGYVKCEKKRFKSYKLISQKIRMLSQVVIDNEHINSFGRALNEGFTEWCTGKCLDGARGYYLQVNVLQIFEIIFGTKEVLKIGIKNHSEIAKMLNMNENEYNIFMSQMDEILYLEKEQEKLMRIKKLVNNKKTSVYISDKMEEMQHKKVFYVREVEKMLVEKLIVPFLEKEKDKETNLPNLKKLNSIYAYLKNFMNEGVYDFSKEPIGDIIVKKYTNEYIEEYLKEKVFEFVNSKNFNIDKLSFADCLDSEYLMDKYCEQNDLKELKMNKLYNNLKNRIEKERIENTNKIKYFINKMKQTTGMIDMKLLKSELKNRPRHVINMEIINLLIKNRNELDEKEVYKIYDEYYYIMYNKVSEEEYKRNFPNPYFTEENGFIRIKNEENQEQDNSNDVVIELKENIKLDLLKEIIGSKNIAINKLLNSRVKERARIKQNAKKEMKKENEEYER